MCRCILHHQMFSICRRVLLLKGDLFGIALECCKLAILRGLFITNVVFWTSQKSMLEVLGSCWQATRISSLDVELCDTLLSLPVVDKAFYSEVCSSFLQCCKANNSRHEWTYWRPFLNYWMKRVVTQLRHILYHYVNHKTRWLLFASTGQDFLNPSPLPMY